MGCLSLLQAAPVILPGGVVDGRFEPVHRAACFFPSPVVAWFPDHATLLRPQVSSFVRGASAARDKGRSAKGEAGRKGEGQKEDGRILLVPLPSAQRASGNRVNITKMIRRREDLRSQEWHGPETMPQQGSCCWTGIPSAARPARGASRVPVAKRSAPTGLRQLFLGCGERSYNGSQFDNLKM